MTAEVTPHHFSLTDEVIQDFDSSAKMAPPLRDEENRQALLEGLKDGAISVIASDHAPHYEAETQQEFDAVPFGVVGLDTAVSLALDRLVGGGVLTLPEMIRKIHGGAVRGAGPALRHPERRRSGGRDDFRPRARGGR